MNDNIWHYLLPVPFYSLLLSVVFTYKESAFNLFMLKSARVIELLCACMFLGFVFWGRAFEFSFIDVHIQGALHVSFGLRADELSSVIFSMITLISYVIFNYSLRYLDGETNQFKFFRNYQITLLFVFLLVLSNNILMFFISWIGISLSLHKLLIHYPDRPKAHIAARKKWIVSRIGDACLLVAIILTYSFFNTLNFSELIRISHDAQSMNHILNQKYFSLIGLLIVISAMAKSAQFPFHFWLPETMETPTPVSALMHAGIINAGGFLVLRFSPIISHTSLASSHLIVVGGLSAVFGALVMMTQTDIKKQLAYSTMSQLGFMMFQCGIGGYTLALFHMICHGFYKAYAFLAIPSMLKERKAPKRNLSRNGLIFSFALGLSLVIYGLFFNNQIFDTPKLIYSGILLFALTQIIGSRNELFRSFKYNFIYSSIFFFMSFCIYYIFEFGLYKKFNQIMPSPFYISIYNHISIVLVVFMFMFSLIIAKKMQNLNSESSKKIWSYFYNGGYFEYISQIIVKKLFGGVK